MNILLITSELFPKMNASSEIVYRIAKILSGKYNDTISILGYYSINCQSEVSPSFIKKTINISNIKKKIFFTNEYNKYLQEKTIKTKYKKIFKFIFDKKYRKIYLNYKYYKFKSVVKEYVRTIRKALNDESYDCVIAFAMPKETLIAVHEARINIPTIFYKLDAISTNYYAKSWDININESELDKSANCIITTDIIYDEYKKGLIAGFDNRKIIPLDFPNIINYRQQVDHILKFDNEHINCVFAGQFYEEIRNPKYFLILIDQIIKKNNNIIFHFFGNLHFFVEDTQLPENVIDHGNVDSETALRNMMAADILVNIGNTVVNQMPSKILTYISLGKPILNIIKNPECPTLKYTNKYPLALDVLETEEVLQEDIDRVISFIIDNKGKEIPFEQIKELYHECTPEYVGDRVYEIICDVIEKSRIKTDVKSRK